MRPALLSICLAAPLIALLPGASAAHGQPHSAAIANVEPASDAAEQPDVADLPEHAAAQLLAEQIRIALSTGDAPLLLSLAKWDGVTQDAREMFSNFVTLLVEQEIGSVTLGPLADEPPTFEYRGQTYGKNGEPLGRVTIAFMVEPPTVSERLHWTYGVEDGTALILLDMPVADPPEPPRP